MLDYISVQKGSVMNKLMCFFVTFISAIHFNPASAYSVDLGFEIPPNNAAYQFCQQTNTYSLIDSPVGELKTNYPGTKFSDQVRWTYWLNVFDVSTLTPTTGVATVSCWVANTMGQCAYLVATYNTYIRNNVSHFGYPNKAQFFPLTASVCIANKILSD